MGVSNCVKVRVGMITAVSQAERLDSCDQTGFQRLPVEPFPHDVQLHEARQARFQPHSPRTPWVFAYQLPLAFDPPEESIKMQ